MGLRGLAPGVFRVLLCPGNALPSISRGSLGAIRRTQRGFAWGADSGARALRVNDSNPSRVSDETCLVEILEVMVVHDGAEIG
jgi:hypothetical protein